MFQNQNNNSGPGYQGGQNIDPRHQNGQNNNINSGNQNWQNSNIGYGYQGSQNNNNPGYQNGQYNSNPGNRQANNGVAGNQNIQRSINDLRFQEPTFRQYCADPKAPRSYMALIKAEIKQRITGFFKNLPAMLVMMLVVTIATTIFNVYFWSVINDTMWAGRGPWGSLSFIPYLIGGGVYSGSAYKGVTPFETAGLSLTGNLVAPLTFALGLLFPRLLMRRKQGGSKAISEDFSSAIPMRDHYEKALGVQPNPTANKTNSGPGTGMPKNQGMSYNQGMPNNGMPYNQGMQNNQGMPNNQAMSDGQRMAENAKELATTNGYIDLSNLSNNIYMRLGLCCAVIFGFIIRNPFAVPVFAVLLYFSFGQGGQSDIGYLFFRLRSADGRLHNGSKTKVPLFSEGMLIMYYMAVGLFMYSAINVILWFLFNYNFYFRFLVSAGLVAAIFVLGGGGSKQAMNMIPMMIVVAFGAMLFNCITAFADDNGWSESGRTLSGLMHNNGFPKSLGSSFLPPFFWDLAILFGWPIIPPMPPGIIDYIPPEPVPPAPSQNPYDFPERPKEWSLNDEGDVSFVNPITGKREKYGLVGYDENGNPRYIGENGNYYDLEDLLISYDNATSNTQYYQDANKGLQEWLERQRIENSKLSRDGMQYLEDKWKWEAQQAKEEREAEQLFKMWQKYGGELDNKESIMKAMEKAIGEAWKDAEKYKADGEYWDKMTKIAEVTEKVADYSLTGLSYVTGNTKIKDIYDITKKYASNMSQAYADGKGAEGMGKAFLSTSAEMCIDKAAGVMGGDGWHWSAKLTGKVGGEVSKQVCKNLEQGKKWNDGLEKAAFNGTVDYVTDKMDKITGGASGEAAKKVWSNLEEGKDWSDGVGSAAFNGGVKGGIDHLADKVKDMQKENRMETFKNDTANMARAEQNGMSKKGLESLEKLRNDTWVENKKAEEAFGLVTDAIKNESKDIYDKVTGEMGKYERDLTKEHNEKMLKDLANRKAENARLAEERKIQEYRDAIRSNAQQPL
ncbi:MFS transporter [Oribacterium sp. FC2011]|uniref:MFS transporter n=1 Tax=Oribacterium sp. FC2011 TaxID=1408311 RepID=UPI0004E12B5A|nr:MFS transporter [Oribacterium sp. FC2011]